MAILAAILVALVVGFVIDLIVTAFAVWVFDLAEIPFLSDLTFWQVFALLIVISIATYHPSSGD